MHLYGGKYITLTDNGYHLGVEAVDYDGKVELHAGELHEPDWQTVDDARRFAVKLARSLPGRYKSIRIVRIVTPGIGPVVDPGVKKEPVR